MIIPHHTPAYLRDMLCEALEYGAEHGDWRAWFVTAQADQFLWRQREGRDWATLDCEERACWLTDRLWNSTEMVPEHVLALRDLAPARTYAEVVRCIRGHGAPDISSRAESLTATHSFSVYLPSTLLERLRRASRQMEMTESDVVRQALEAWLS